MTTSNKQLILDIIERLDSFDVEYAERLLDGSALSEARKEEGVGSLFSSASLLNAEVRASLEERYGAQWREAYTQPNTFRVRQDLKRLLSLIRENLTEEELDQLLSFEALDLDEEPEDAPYFGIDNLPEDWEDLSDEELFRKLDAQRILKHVKDPENPSLWDLLYLVPEAELLENWEHLTASERKELYNSHLERRVEDLEGRFDSQDPVREFSTYGHLATRVDLTPEEGDT